MKEQENVGKFRKFMQVAASPMNPVKFQLGICLLVALLLVIALSLTQISQGLQLGLLLAYSFCAALFIVWRVKRVIYAASQKH